MFSIGTVGPVFLADDAVVGIAVGDQAADGGLGLFVGLGDGIEAGRAPLVLMADVRAEEGQGDARGFARQFDGEGFVFGHAVPLPRFRRLGRPRCVSGRGAVGMQRLG